MAGNPTGHGLNSWQKSTDSSVAYSICCLRRLPSASVSFRYLPSASVTGRFWSVWMMETCLGARMAMSGEHIWQPNMPWAKFSEKSTVSSSVSVIFLLPPTSVCFRQHPPSSGGVRFGSLLARVSDGWKHGWGQADDIGRAYLETQHAMGQICGENRPILVLLIPFFCFRQLPSASVCFRHLPSASVSGRFWSVCLIVTWVGPGWRYRKRISGNPTIHWQNLWRK